MTRSIVVVHGVGAPDPGAEIEKIADAVSDAGTSMRKTTLRSRGQDIPVGELIHNGERVCLFEMNWSRTVAPATTTGHVIRQAFRLLFVVTQIAQSGWSTPAETDNAVAYPSLVGKLFRWTLMAITIWAPILAATVIMAEILNDQYANHAKGIAIVVGALVALAGFYVLKVDRLAGLAAFAWAFAVLVFGLMVADEQWTRDAVSKWVTLPFVAFGIFGSGLLLIAGVAESFWRGKAAPPTWRSSAFRASMFVIPFVIFAAAWPPIVFTVQFMVVDQFIGAGGLTDKEVLDVYDAVAKGLPYDLVQLEILNFIVFIIATFALVFFCLIWNGVLQTEAARRWEWGGQFRRLVSVWLLILIVAGSLTVFPVLLQSTATVIGNADHQSRFPEAGLFKSAFDLLFPFFRVENSSVLEVYRASMWRIAAILLFFLPKVGQMIAIFSQIVFYIAPIWSPLSSRHELLEQFRNVVEIASQKSEGPPIILAYSQGSKIAVDALANGTIETKKLVTIGSPVDAIHRTFLSMPVPRRELNWHNFFRSSDFIGGSINEPNVKNARIDQNFTSTHFKYYREEKVLSALELA